MSKVKKYYKKYEDILKYGFFGCITVGINLGLYKLFLIIGINYLIASIISYIIASLISYYFNLIFVFKQNILGFKEELVRIIKYFSVRIGSVLADTILLAFFVEVLKFDEFYSKIFISVFIILITYIFNKKILKNK